MFRLDFFVAQSIKPIFINRYESWGDAYRGILSILPPEVNHSSIRVASMQGVTIVRYGDSKKYYCIIDESYEEVY